MGGCCVPNCSNSSRKGFRLFRFPTDKIKCEIWRINCGRDDWKPTTGSRLCEEHFDESQYELNRLDGKKLLKKSAIPTIFDVPKRRVNHQKHQEDAANQCAALNCTNSDKNGFALYAFPRDHGRREQWATNCQSSQWVPAASSRLCEVHFDDEQFAKTRLGGKRLTSTAVPKLFDAGRRRALTRRKLLRDIQCENSDGAEATLPRRKRLKKIDVGVDGDPDDGTRLTASAPKDKAVGRDVPDTDDEHVDTATRELRKRVFILQHENQQLKQRNAALMAQLKQFSVAKDVKTTSDDHTYISNSVPDGSGPPTRELLQLQAQSLQSQRAIAAKRMREFYAVRRKLQNLRANLAKFLNRDQIETLEGQSGPAVVHKSPWSEDTINQAIQVRCSVGRVGYKCLRTTGFPLPSERTLMRWIQRNTASAEERPSAAGGEPDPVDDDNGGGGGVVDALGVAPPQEGNAGNIETSTLEQLMLQSCIPMDDCGAVQPGQRMEPFILCLQPPLEDSN